MYRKKMKNAGGPNLTDKIGAKVKKVRKKVGGWKRKRNENGIVSLHGCKKKKTKEISCPFVCKLRLYDIRGER